MFERPGSKATLVKVVCLPILRVFLRYVGEMGPTLDWLLNKSSFPVLILFYLFNKFIYIYLELSV